MWWLSFLVALLDAPRGRSNNPNACCPSCARGGTCQRQGDVGLAELDEQPTAWTINALPPMRGRIVSNVGNRRFARFGRLTGGRAEVITVRCECPSLSTGEDEGCTQTSCIQGLGCKVIASWSCAAERASREGEKGN